MSGFEPPISRPPDAHFNRTKLHPEYNLWEVAHFNYAFGVTGLPRFA